MRRLDSTIMGSYGPILDSIRTTLHPQSHPIICKDSSNPKIQQPTLFLTLTDSSPVMQTSYEMQDSPSAY